MSISPLLELTLRGSLVFLAAALADRLLAANMSARWRRIWWLLVPVAFLVPLSPVLMPFFAAPPHGHVPAYPVVVPQGIPGQLVGDVTSGMAAFHAPSGIHLTLVTMYWLAGVIVGTLRLALATATTARGWSRLRLCTASRLLDALENAKAIAGVTAPIGLVISERVPSPALLGWLRPRILLPSRFADCAPEELRAVLFHELAHFKHLDLPANWLFAAVRVVHWFNPLAWLAVAQWNRFREEAADEQAICWLAQPGGAAYGEILLKTLRECPHRPPYGALAIGESVHDLKRRILMIHHHASKTNRGALGGLVILLLAALMTLSPMLAVADAAPDDATSKKAAVDAMTVWLAESDAGDYAKTWKDAAPSFQKAVTPDQWTAAATSVRTPLGKLTSRKLASSLLQESPGTASLPKGTFVIAQFDSSFENLKSALETVTFEHQPDGTWRAAGYYIKPQ